MPAQAGSGPHADGGGFVTPGFGVSTCPHEGRHHPVEIHTATPEGLSVFPLFYS